MCLTVKAKANRRQENPILEENHDVCMNHVLDILMGKLIFLYGKIILEY